MKFKLYIMIVLLWSIPTAEGKDLVDLKPVPLLEFMQGDLIQTYPITILVPTEYMPFEFATDAPGKYFWMRSKDAKKAEEKNELPIKKGFMYGKITMNVGYDASKDLFIGIEDAKTQKEMSHYFDDFSMQRTNANGYPVLLVKMINKELKNPSYLMYIASKVSTNVIVIAYIPPKYSVEKGDYVWRKQWALFKPAEVDATEQQDQSVP